MQMGNKMTSEKGGSIEFAEEFHQHCVNTCCVLHEQRQIVRELRDKPLNLIQENSKKYAEKFQASNEEIYRYASAVRHLYMRTDTDEQTKKLKEHYEKKIAQLTQQLHDENKAKDEALSRVSELLSQMLKSGNPDIADLSDPRRPTVLGEQFKCTYDDEWTDAFEVLTDGQKMTDNGSIDMLYNMLKQCNELCVKASELQYQQLESAITTPYLFKGYSTKITVGYDTGRADAQAQMSKTIGATPSSQTLGHSDTRQAQVVGQTPSNKLEPHIRDFRKLGAVESLPMVEQEIIQAIKDGKRFPGDILKNTDIVIYLKKCIRLCWLMASQYPPMEVNFDLQPGDRFNVDLYKEYQTRGDKTARVVWPPVFLHHKGPVVCKGYAEAEKK